MCFVLALSYFFECAEENTMTSTFFASLLTLAISACSFVLDAFLPVIFFVAACCIIGAAFTFIRFVISLRG